jgi:glycosyltransferase involved in cell wall biosynthesis
MDLLYISGMSLHKNSAQYTQLIEKKELFNSLGYETEILTPLITARNYFFIPYLSQIFLQVIFFFQVLTKCIDKHPRSICSRSALSLHILFLAKLLNIKYLTEVHGCLREEMVIQNTSLLHYIIVLFSEKICYKLCDRIITVTDQIKNDIVQYYCVNPKKIIVIGNGVNTSLFTPHKIPVDLNITSLISKKFIVGFSGSLICWQGVDYLISAMSYVVKEKQNCHLVIVGDGPEKHNLECLTKKLNLTEYVTFIGNVDYNILADYINLFNICICYKIPLKSGYSPLKLFEYMACGKPIIASNVAGFEVITEKNIGLLVTPRSEKELAKAILILIQDDLLTQKMGRNAREYAERECSWNIAVQKYIEELK